MRKPEYPVRLALEVGVFTVLGFAMLTALAAIVYACAVFWAEIF